MIERSDRNPLITPASGDIGNNINGPSVIEVPDWIKNRLGRFYLYFGHHGGNSIRLAYADHPEGPWTVFPGGVLHLNEVTGFGFHGHIASPDAHVDTANRRIVLFFHGPYREQGKLADAPLHTVFNQMTGIAFSADGLAFNRVGGQAIAFPYLRVFRYTETLYGLSCRGLLFRFTGDEWPDGSQTFEERTQPLGYWRHCAVHLHDNRLYVFFSRWGDEPERIAAATVELNDDWHTWEISRAVPLLRPQTVAEGADLPVRPSVPSAARGRVHELRDPCFFQTGNQDYLYYGIAGESGISVARFNPGWRDQLTRATANGPWDPPDAPLPVQL